jgi:hypothetical protein
MSEKILPANQINVVTGVSVTPQVLGKFTTIIAVADITTTVQTVLALKVRSSQPDRADTVVGTVPTGAQICFLGIRIPSGIIATNGNAIKLAPAVSATGVQTFDAAGATAYVRSAVAASGTFTAGASLLTISPLNQSTAALQSAALSGPLTFSIYNDNGAAVAGAGISVASGTAQIVAQIVYWEPLEVPRLEAISGRPARG